MDQISIINTLTVKSYLVENLVYWKILFTAKCLLLGKSCLSENLTYRKSCLLENLTYRKACLPENLTYRESCLPKNLIENHFLLENLTYRTSLFTGNFYL